MIPFAARPRTGRAGSDAIRSGVWGNPYVTGVQLRLAGPQDADATRAIYNAEVLGSTFVLDLVPRSREDQLRWLAEHGGAHPVVVAVDATGEVAGFASLSTYRDRPAYATTVEDSVYVASAFRGKGTGKLLMEEIIRLARVHGFHSVVARIVGDNEASVALHRRFGFTLVGVEREIGRKFGRWLDVAVMQLLLG